MHCSLCLWFVCFTICFIICHHQEEDLHGSWNSDIVIRGWQLFQAFVVQFFASRTFVASMVLDRNNIGHERHNKFSEEVTYVTVCIEAT